MTAVLHDELRWMISRLQSKEKPSLNRVKLHSGKRLGTLLPSVWQCSATVDEK